MPVQTSFDNALVPVIPPCCEPNQISIERMLLIRANETMASMIVLDSNVFRRHQASGSILMYYTNDYECEN